MIFNMILINIVRDYISGEVTLVEDKLLRSVIRVVLLLRDILLSSNVMTTLLV